MFSVVIPNLHSPQIAQVVGALRRQTAAGLVGEIIVVGQDRHGLTPPDVTRIETERPLAAAAARNLGARRAAGELLLFVDSDCVARPDLVAQLAEAHRSGAQIVSGAVIPETGAYWSLCDNLLVFADFLPAAPRGERPAIASLNMSIRRALFLELGGFDERFPGAAGEDLDFGLRARERGHALRFEPLAQVAHLHRRPGPRDTWGHLRGFGRAHLRVARARRGAIGGAAARLRRRDAPLIMALALPLALADAAGLFLTRRQLWPYLWALPGVAWAKSGWYWGLAEALASAPSAEHEWR